MKALRIKQNTCVACVVLNDQRSRLTMQNQKLEKQKAPTSERSQKMKRVLHGLYEKYLPMQEGRPSLAALRTPDVSSDTYGLACIPAEGGDFVEMGDTQVEFPALSLVKPLIYGLALEDNGLVAVREKIGVEPTGTAFDGLLQQSEISQKRFNPMVNLGAIATTSLISGKNLEEKGTRILSAIGGFTGREMSVSHSMIQHRRKKISHNRALAYYMESEGLLSDSVEASVELFDFQCSILLTCRDLAMIGATLANGGINPFTRKRAISNEWVKNVLSVMFTSGLYNDSGQWAHRVGTPAKSGLAGAIWMVSPGEYGAAAFSPKMNSNHKSLRGQKALTELSDQLKSHVFNGERPTPTPKPQSFSSKRRTSVSTLLGQLHEEFAPLKTGKPYICDPTVHSVDPDRFGICAVDVDGRALGVGDWQYPFLIQSISKVFVYGLALEDHGRDYVHRKVDVEPSGAPYDAIIKLEQKTKRPFNPMVNTGGIATTSLIKGKTRGQRLQRILDMYSRYMGHEVVLDAPTFLAEQQAGDRNRAISYLLRHFGMMNGSVDDALDLYLQQCSVRVTAKDLAVMAATLASGGVNPLTGVRAIASEYVQDLLSVMYTCGMYDFAGAWAYEVGFPSKSGVGGGIIAVAPGRMGLAVFSPPLDERGNSVRGIQVFESLSRKLKLHIFDKH